MNNIIALKWFSLQQKQQQQHHQQHHHQKSESQCWFADYFRVGVSFISLLVLFCVDEYQQIGKKQQQQRRKREKHTEDETSLAYTTVLTFTSFEIIG